MSATYIPIQSTTLSSNQASVTFSDIPQTYTDLVIRGSIRSNRASSLVDTINYNFNSSTANFSNTKMEGTGAASNGVRNQTNSSLIVATASSVAANTFTSFEIYLPNYAGSTNKPFGSFFAYEDNATIAYVGAVASLRSNTAAITSITLGLVTGPNFVSGSSFHLYGISNA